MNLKENVTKEEWEKLAEGVKNLYMAEGEGEGYILNVEKLKNTIAATRSERDAAKDALKPFIALGKSPEEIQGILKVYKEMEEEKVKKEEEELKKKGEFDKFKAQLLESQKKELADRDEKVQKMKTTMESYIVDAAATEAIATAKGIPQLLLPHVKASVKVVEEDGKYLVRVIGPDGAPRMNAKGEFLGIKDLVGEMRQNEVFGRAFEASGTGGSGAPTPGWPGNKGGFVLSREDAKDPMKYRAAREAAQKAGQELQIAPE